MAQPGEYRFSRRSPVGRFWLARCTGFRAFAGRRELGTVVEIGFASLEGDVRALFVTRRLRRTVIPVDHVLEIDPWNETVAVARPSRQRGRGLAMAGASAGLAASRGLRTYGLATVRIVRTGSVAAGRRTTDGLAWTAPRARRFALLALRTLVTAIFVAFITMRLLLRAAVAGLAAVRPYVVRAARGLRRTVALALGYETQRPASRAERRSTSRRRPV